MVEDIIIKKLENLEKLIESQSLLQKEVLNFSETCLYLQISESHLYKLTSRKQIPHFCPNGKKLYFNRHELDSWLQQKKQTTMQEIDKAATDYILTHRR
jgi:excisionase family DNA binding protein